MATIGSNDLAPHFEAGRKLFAGEAGFIWAASRIDNLPPMKGVEIAFAGRSNVGKSSLVNALTGRKTLARTSHTPGRTQELNFFDLGGATSAGSRPGKGSVHGSGQVTPVDMPGYGFRSEERRVGKECRSRWSPYH